MESSKLGGGSGYVDIRMVNHAKNPFCTFGAIDGAITIQITQGGNWAIRSGSYRRMPNHGISIYNGGNVTWLLRSPYQSPGAWSGPTRSNPHTQAPIGLDGGRLRRISRG